MIERILTHLSLQAPCTATLNCRLLKQLVDSGDAFLEPASVKGRTGLRACFVNLRTTEADVDSITERLATLAAQP